MRDRIESILTTYVAGVMETQITVDGPLSQAEKWDDQIEMIRSAAEAAGHLHDSVDRVTLDVSFHIGAKA